MPNLPARYCSGPGCTALVGPGAPCPRHPARPRPAWRGRPSSRARYGPGYDDAKRRRVLERDGYRCQVLLECVGADATEVDHIVPVSEGGSSNETNLRASCAACNRRLIVVNAQTKRRRQHRAAAER